MDALSDVLRVIRLTGGVYLHAEFFEPWCMVARLEPDHCAPFLPRASHLILYHYVVEGRIGVRMADGTTLHAGAGDVVLFPRNDSHLLGSDLDQPPVRGSDVIRPPTDGGLNTIRLGDDGARSQMICGCLGCDCVESNPLISSLPALLHFNVEESSGAAWIRSTFQYAADEVATGRPGSETVLAKLSELLFVEAVRRYAESLPPEQVGWLAGIRDRHVGRALAAFHRDPARNWTVSELGREVGLSRSALAERFTRLIEQAPMQYLANLRMQIAADELRDTDASLIQVAEKVGYESEAAFSRAFKKAFGSAPATWRRQAVHVSEGVVSDTPKGGSAAGARPILSLNT